jgi:glucan 1,3-beta-glucosidase
MGLVNAERSLSYIRTLAQFIAQPQYAPIASMFHVANEVAMLNIGEIQTKSFYVEAYNLVRNITGIGAGNGPMLPIHNGFVPDNTWYGYMTGADRLALETQ